MGNSSSQPRANAASSAATAPHTEPQSGVALMTPTATTTTRATPSSTSAATPRGVTAAKPVPQLLTSMPPLPVPPVSPPGAGGQLHDHLAAYAEHQKANLVAALEAEFGCSHDCAVSTVEAYFPCEDTCRAVVQAKMTASFVEVVGLVSKQREYLDKLCSDLRSAFAHFPLLNGSMTVEDSDVNRTNDERKDGSCSCSCGDAGGSGGSGPSQAPIDWSAVRARLFAPDKARLLYQHAELANVGVPNDLAVLENAYRALVLKKGFTHLIGCYASGDGVVAAMDYVNERLRGTPVQDLARRMHFDAEVVDALNGVEANTPTVAQTRVNAFGNNPGTSHTKRQDKGSSQEALRDAGLAYIRSVVTTHAEEAIEKIQEGALLLPVVVKPSTGAGSEFVTLCYTEHDVAVAFEMVEGMRTSQGTDAAVLVVEEYIEGPEYVVNTVSYNGVAAVTDVWQSWKYPKAVFTTGMSHAAEQNLRSTSLNERKRNKTSILYDKQVLVSDLASLPPTHEARRVAEYTLRCLDALELRNGCAHCELRVDMREAAARRRRSEQFDASSTPLSTPVTPPSSHSSSPTAPSLTVPDGDEARSHHLVGEPVLIELNPRMQGDAPRSTEVVGYDQFSLMVYIGEAVNIFGGATAASTQLPFRVSSPSSSAPQATQQQRPSTSVTAGEPSAAASAASARGDIPWPPVPRFYHPFNPSNPPCITVLFLVASGDCILNGAALPHLTGLPSFERFTRTIFKANVPGYVTPLRQTVDLFSSPSACVMRGTAAQVEADCATIRAMEAATVPAVTRSMLQDAVSKTESVRVLRSALHDAERRLQYLKELKGEERDGPVPSLHFTGDPAGVVVDEDAAATSYATAKTATLLAEAQRMRDTLMVNMVETRQHLDELRSAIKAELLQQTPAPLYIANDTFNLMKHCDLGSMLSVL